MGEYHKGRQTRQMILERAAPLFNMYGYVGASISDVMKATGLEKGGIYRHFATKEDLALESFDHASGIIRAAVRQALRGRRTATERLEAVFETWERFAENPPIPGGCPVLNTAVSTDHAHPALRGRARAAIEEWRKLFVTILGSGQKREEIRPDVDIEATTLHLIASLEGGLMQSSLFDDPALMQSVTASLREYVHDRLAVGR